MSAIATDLDTGAWLKRTPLHGLHLELGAKMVPYAGHEMPLSYGLGIIKEHLHTRSAAGLFDVSHMGQIFVSGPDHDTTAAALERLMPQDLRELELGEVRYGFLLNDQGGVIDDLMVTRSVSTEDDGRLLLVVNAGRVDVDLPFLAARMPEGVDVAAPAARALLALQGPAAAAVLARHCPEAAALAFMTATSAEFDGTDCHVSRTGYTGEDGYQISVAGLQGEPMARALLAEPEVAPAGLGARDSLRLEAGLNLYGHELDETTTPVEAGLAWAIGKRRRMDGGFPGAARVSSELTKGADRCRVGILPVGKAPAREGTEIQSGDGRAIGRVTSGVFSPSLGAPVAMGTVGAAFAASGTEVRLMIRGTSREARVADLPFVPHRYHRTSQT